MTDWLDRFVEAMDGPLVVVTTRAADDESVDTPAGCVVGFANQVSIEPWRFLVALSIENHTYAVAKWANHLAVHLLDDAHIELARLFGSTTSDRLDKFGACDWHIGPRGLPILDGVPVFVGRIRSRFVFGDHVGHLLDPVDMAGPEPDPSSSRGRVSVRSARDWPAGHPRHAVADPLQPG